MSINEKRKEVEEKIRNWLIEEGFKVKMMPNEHTSFNFVAEDEEGRKVNIVQSLKKRDQILIITRAVLTKEQQQKLMLMKEEERNQFLWTLRLGLLNRGVGFSSISAPLESVMVSKPIYYDGLTKDSFMHRLFEVRKALLFVFWMVDRELGEPEPTLEPYYIR